MSCHKCTSQYFWINMEDCLLCASCLEVCQRDAIFEEDDEFHVDDKCNKCDGISDSPECLDVCPVDCIISKE